MTTAAFDPFRALRMLRARRVRFVVIGGFAGRIWGSPTVTNDLDICYARDAANLHALAAALVELGARLRGVSEEVPFKLDAATLRAGDHFTLTTDAGNLDVLGTPAGSGGFEGLMRTAQRIDLDGLSVHVATVDDLIEMKRASTHPKDRIEVEILSAVREERQTLGRD